MLAPAALPPIKTKMIKKQIFQLKAACYAGSFTMALVNAYPPLLFLTFHREYGISFSLLGFLVVINFLTQLGIDLIFSFFSHRFNIAKTIRMMPLFTIAGFIIYTLWGLIFPHHVYIGLVIGTLLFSASSGLGEVLISPIFAETPAKDPEREMSKLHSCFAWGCVVVVLMTSLFLLFFDAQHWRILTLLFNALPLICFLLYCKAEIPPMQTPKRSANAFKMLKNPLLLLLIFTIFLAGSTECTMSQWASGYLEQALKIPKLWGDLFGVAFFSIMLGLGRSLYGKFGNRLEPILLCGAIGAAACYLAAALSSSPLIGLIACALTGLCAAMLWPGTLMIATEKFPAGGVFIYAIIASGGDLGASIGPQIVGIITDRAILSSKTVAGLQPEQFGMKAGMLIGALFPLVLIPIYIYFLKHQPHHKKKDV